MPTAKQYIAELKRRAKESRVYRSYQLEGLEIAELLDDEAHKSLYIKLVKKHGGGKLRTLAHEIAQNKRIAKKGAYFMTCIAEQPWKKTKSGS